MSALADIGAIIEVTPWDEIWVKTSEDPCEYVNDARPFRFRVQGRLEDGQIFFGLYGRVIDGPGRYRGLICNVMVRASPTDWRIAESCQANFKVGPSVARWNHDLDFRHPEGTVVEGFPVIGRFGAINLVGTKNLEWHESPFEPASTRKS